MGTAATVILVGTAILSPSLLFEPGSLVAGDVESTYETKAPVSAAQRAAMTSLRSPICGVADHAPKNFEAANRFIRVMLQLQPLVGACPTSKGLANVSSAQAVEIHERFEAACLAGVNQGGFLVGKTSLKFTSQAGLALALLDNQAEALAAANQLGRALHNSSWMRRVANVGGDVFNAEDSMTVCSRLAVAIDAAGVDYSNLGSLLDDLLDTINPTKFGERVLEATPGKILDGASAVLGKVGGVAGAALSALLTSTPMLALVAGIVVWKTVGK